MIDLVIVRAPHQVLYSIERLRESKLKSVLVLDMFETQDYNNAITGILKYKKWDRVIKMDYSAKDVRGAVKYIYYLVIIKILSIYNLRLNNLIVGDGSIVFAKLILDNFKYINNTVIIGDGTDLIIKNESKKEIRYYCRIGMKAKIILKLLNLKFIDEYKYDELFTYFQVDDPRLKPNDFSILKYFIKESQGNIVDCNCIYFLGTILLDRFKKKEVEGIYKQIFDRYSTLEIKYIPHRRATLEEIEIARSTGRVTIVESKGTIIETFFMENNIIPITLGSFFSNAIFSLAAIYPNLNIDVFHVIRREGENIVNPTDRRILEIMSNEILDDRIRCKMIQI